MIKDTNEREVRAVMGVITACNNYLSIHNKDDESTRYMKETRKDLLNMLNALLEE